MVESLAATGIGGDGGMEGWSGGVVESWSDGMMDWWIGGLMGEGGLLSPALSSEGGEGGNEPGRDSFLPVRLVPPAFGDGAESVPAKFIGRRINGAGLPASVTVASRREAGAFL